MEYYIYLNWTQYFVSHCSAMLLVNSVGLLSRKRLSVVTLQKSSMAFESNVCSFDKKKQLFGEIEDVLWIWSDFFSGKKEGKSSI